MESQRHTRQKGRAVEGSILKALMEGGKAWMWWLYFAYRKKKAALISTHNVWSFDDISSDDISFFDIKGKNSIGEKGIKNFSSGK